MSPPDPAPTASPARARRPTRAGVAVGLVVAGLLLWALYRVLAATEQHSYDPGASPASDVELRAGHRYSISIPGGLTAALTQLPDSTAPSCRITPVGGAAAQLGVTVESPGTKATTRIGTFVSPVTGRAAISCTGVSGVFVDDAEDSGYDWSGLSLLLASIALMVGLPLLLSVVRGHVGHLGHVGRTGGADGADDGTGSGDGGGEPGFRASRDA